MNNKGKQEHQNIKQSLIDYLICDAYCYHKLSTFIIEPLNSDSDHTPIVFGLKLNLINNIKKTNRIVNVGKSDRKDKFYK